MTRNGGIPVWDPLVRICHWSFVAGFVLNYFILEPGKDAHEIAGYTVFSLVIVRLFWGFFSRGYAGFRHFHFSRRALIEHKQHLVSQSIPTDSGHNPVGWLMVFAVLFLFSVLGVTGFLMEEVDALFGNDMLEAIHELAANSLFALVCIHIAAVVFTLWKGNIELIRPMITGTRRPRD
ncbi:cytochrome b/b6 domain-containing protein [Alteromonas sp. CYL-A6]|uniref:cytochrome b/b6 domain-containing protein n=1 Tax=Alteromonas nitratireducens TaxID=3390813 RepID=UPI0034AE6459